MAIEIEDKNELLDEGEEAGPESESEEQAEENLDPLKGKEELQRALKDLVNYAFMMDRAERLQEVQDAALQRFYYRDLQYIWWSSVDGCYAAAPQGLQTFQVGDSHIDMPRYTDVYNIYTPYGRSLIAAFTQNPPGVRFAAKNPRVGRDNTAKAEAERYRHYFDRANDNKKLQQDMARLYYTDTRTTTYTRYCEKEEREISEAFGTLETKVPMRARNIKKCPYFIISQEIECVEAKEDNPEFADKISPGPSGFGEEYERTARMGVLSGGSKLLTADVQSHLVTQHWVWMRPSWFHNVGKKQGTKSTKNDEGKHQEITKELRELFPNGCHVCFMGDVYVGSRAESMDDHLEVSFPLPGDSMSRRSMGWSIVPVQNTTNDSYNLWKETYDYTIPVTWINAKIADMPAIREQISEPGNHIPFGKPAGESMEDQFHTENPASVSADFVSFVQDVRGNLAQFISGAVPSLWGGAMPDQKTASGYAMAREQALGQMGLPWGSMQRHFARIYEQAVMIAAEKRGDTSLNVEITGKRGTRVEEMNFGNISVGKILCFPDVDSSFPETFSAKRQSLMQLISMAGEAILPFLQTPNNLKVFLQALGVEDFEIPAESAGDQQLREMEKLLAETPVPDTKKYEQAKVAWMVQVAAAKATEQQTGQPAAQPIPPEPKQEDFTKPSVNVDVECNDHAAHWEVVKEFLESVDGEHEKESNPKGWTNLRMHGLIHKALAEADAQKQQQKKPPSMTMNFKDMPAEGQIQMAAMDGIKLNPPQPGDAGAAAAA
jgi:hypothetical protein